MRRLKLTLEYDGSKFFGWQIQARTGERTVQGVLQAALTNLPGTHSPLCAAGRTDAGVHALAMVCHFDTSTYLPITALQRAINAYLPPDVRVLGIEEVATSFEAQYGCHYRAYCYRMRLARADLRGVCLDRLRVLHLYQQLDVVAMQAAARLFEGKQDFASLATQEHRGTVRTVHLCRLEQRDRNLSLLIAADGFLRNMVRAVVGTLLRVGEGKLKPEDIPRLLATRDRRQAGENAPPHGLYFLKASYELWDNSNPETLWYDTQF